MKVKIVTDSICAPSAERTKELKIEIVPINLHFGNTVYRDLLDLNSTEFYQKLVEADELPTTSAPSPNRFAEVFRKILGEGNELICLTVTSKLSNTYHAAVQAKEEFTEAESSKIRIFDTEAAGASASLLAVDAARQASKGKSADEIEKRLNALKPKAKLVVMFDTLKYIEKSGRVGSVAAVAGDLFRVKPVIYLHQSETKFFGRGRGRRHAVKMILQEFFTDTQHANSVQVAATHANAEEHLSPLLEEISLKYPDLSIDIVPFTAAMGSHAGPGIIGIGYLYE